LNRSAPFTLAVVASIAAPAGAPLLAVAAASNGPSQAHAASVGRLVSGASYHMRWGDVQVRIRLDSSNRHVVNVGAVTPTERSRSAQINNRALPILKREVLSAQSANIHAVSGATLTSNAYKQSLRSALSKAHL
jgi:uncharacterized protein with FMN-binding domain